MRALVAGWIGSTNVGDELIYQGLCRHLAALGITPVALSKSPVRTADLHGTDAVQHRNPTDTVRLFRAMRSTDALVFGGGGLIQDQTSPWNVPFHTSRVAVARLARRPWAGVGLGIDPLTSRVARVAARSGLGGSVGIAVRDAPSMDAGRRLGLQPALAADLALALDPSPAPVSDRIVVALRPSNRPGIGTAERKAAGGMHESWEASMAPALDALAALHGLEVHMVAFQPDRDEPLHARVAAAMTAPVTFARATLDRVLDEVAASRIVVTMRYHGAITALLAGRPALLLDYSPKMTNLADDVGDGFATVQPGEITVSTMCGLAGAVMDRGDTLDEARARLQARESVNRDVLERLVDAVG